MLQRSIILIFLLILFVNIRAQQVKVNDDNQNKVKTNSQPPPQQQRPQQRSQEQEPEDDEDEENEQQQQQPPPEQKQQQPPPEQKQQQPPPEQKQQQPPPEQKQQAPPPPEQKQQQQQQQQVRSSQSETQKSAQNVNVPTVNSTSGALNSIKTNPPASNNENTLVPRLTATTLANSSECAADVQKYCVKGGVKYITNRKVLQCVDDLDNAHNLIAKECQHIIYKFKLSITQNIFLDDTAIRRCPKDLQLIQQCNKNIGNSGTGHLVPCLYEFLNNVTDDYCREFLKLIQTTIFTDWRLSETFVLMCSNDIDRLHCGRLDVETDTLPHEQGAVLSCLGKSHSTLSKNCSKHILRLTEMQSDDYQLDRALYYACREDRERFCSQVVSGNGRVYRCLYEQKFNNMMSPACREEIHRRQKLVASNALVDAPLVRACKSEMDEHKCVANPNAENKKLSLTNLLLCLESRLKSGNQINDNCQREMLIHRRMLMVDYSISPKIIEKCRDEMIQHCSSLYQQGVSGTIEQRNGRMIHCLLKAASQEKSFSANCLTTVKSLIRAVDPGSDIRADPFLETACRPVIDALCSKLKSGDSNIMLCLLNNLRNSKMTDDCEDRLMEVSYFMVRDWRITPRLLGACQGNLANFCQLPQNWTMRKEMKDVQIGTYLSCLYLRRSELTNECRAELKQLLRIRSQSIGLMPEIQDNCIIDLATCKNPDMKGEEIRCLQKKYSKLEEKCREVIRNYTAMTIEDPTFDFSLMKSCEAMIQLFCPNAGGNDGKEIMPCLIRQKSNQRMDYRCKASIEHYQIISLRDKAFLSEQFRQRCDPEIQQHCPNKKTKSTIIQCLARLMLYDVLKKSTALSNECRDELKFELLQRSETINLDPSLAKACINDIRQFCPNQNPGNAQILDCLKNNRNKVSSACYDKLKIREKIDVIVPDNDYSLTTNCAPVIQKYCSTENKQNILACLRQNVNRDVTSNTCRKVLFHRLMILNSDARFNKGLIDNCQTAINQYCADEVIDIDEEQSKDDDSDDDDNNDDDNRDTVIINNGDLQDRDMGGRVIACLRTAYANRNAVLTSECVGELADVVHASKIDVELDVKLAQSCRQILQTKCPGTDKEDCLKVLYQKNQLTDQACRQQVIRIIKEGQADIYVDEGLTISCRTDILRYCNDIPMGGGKQLQCLIKLGKLLSSTCRAVLTKRQELWRTVPDIDNINDLAQHLIQSSNSSHLFAIITAGFIFVFLAGCLCRTSCRRRRISKYH